MDTNKLTKLRTIGYTIPATCETCVYSDLSPDGWGYCGVHEYTHGKHNEDTSFLSVHRMGSCTEHQLDDAKVATLGLHAFHEFLPQPGDPNSETTG